MEISVKIKEKLFAQYLGQPFRVILNDGSFRVTECNLGTIQLLNPEDILILKELSKITNEDAIEIQKILGFKMDTKSKYFFEICNATFPENAIEIYQFLQHKGYDMPHYLLDGKTLQESGLAIYE